MSDGGSLVGEGGVGEYVNRGRRRRTATMTKMFTRV